MDLKKLARFWDALVLALLMSRVHSLPNFPQKPLLQHNELNQVELGTNDQNEKPWAVGFELGPTYGTASVRWANGNYSHVVKIDGDEKYHDAMRFFGSQKAVHPHKPYQFFGEDWVDLPRRLLRHARKAVGLPATEEVGALAAMLKDLRTATQWHLEDVVERAVVVRPNLNAFYEEDMFDALEYADLPYLRICHFDYRNLTAEHARESDYNDCAVPVAHFAAVAGEGIGMCSDYSDDDACLREGKKRDAEVTLVVDWAQEYLQITSRNAKIPYELWGGESEYRSDTIRYDLGYADIPDRDNDDAVDEWWGRLGNYTFEILRRARSGVHDVDHVLLVGDAMRMSESRGSGVWIYWPIEEILEELGQESSPKYYWDCDEDAVDEYQTCGDQDPAFTGANGAAEMAWRWERGLWTCSDQDRVEGKCGEELRVK